ncbi:MAG: Jag N-terminal domain-containing protein, partial [Lachnospiraceae bacterium]|nr:Jag N-terminal domain-containing protein [Lachnospiraceae bacterium]
MADWKKFTGATVDEAFTKACIDFGMPSSELEMVVTQKESAGLLGLFRKDAEIQVRVKKAEKAPEVKAAEPVKAEPKAPEKAAEP